MKEQFKERIKGEIVVVKYLCDNHLLQGRFVNLTDDDINFLYHNLGKWSGRDIQILEIKRLPTFISDIGFEKDVL
ncbi:MAG: hypothetical protein NC131_06060 [Roseburia sp.]|nr:hypothetical protein [Roseburia sp.]